MSDNSIFLSSGKPKSSKIKKREDGFDVRNLGSAKLSEYNALFDPNMRHYCENKKIQQHLYKTGQIDSHGRVIDMDKNKTKIFILEREFKQAELTEQRRMKEEMEMRVRNFYIASLKITLGYNMAIR